MMMFSSGRENHWLHTCVPAHTSAQLIPCPRSSHGPMLQRVLAGHLSHHNVSSCHSVTDRGTDRDPAHPDGPSLGASCSCFLPPPPAPISFLRFHSYFNRQKHSPTLHLPSLSESKLFSCLQPVNILELKITRNLQPLTLNLAKRFHRVECFHFLQCQQSA